MRSSCGEGGTGTDLFVTTGAVERGWRQRTGAPNTTTATQRFAQCHRLVSCGLEEGLHTNPICPTCLVQQGRLPGAGLLQHHRRVPPVDEVAQAAHRRLGACGQTGLGVASSLPASGTIFRLRGRGTAKLQLRDRPSSSVCSSTVQQVESTLLAPGGPTTCSWLWPSPRSRITSPPKPDRAAGSGAKAARRPAPAVRNIGSDGQERWHRAGEIRSNSQPCCTAS